MEKPSAIRTLGLWSAGTPIESSAAGPDLSSCTARNNCCFEHTITIQSLTWQGSSAHVDGPSSRFASWVHPEGRSIDRSAKATIPAVQRLAIFSLPARCLLRRGHQLLQISAAPHHASIALVAASFMFEVERRGCGPMSVMVTDGPSSVSGRINATDQWPREFAGAPVRW